MMYKVPTEKIDRLLNHIDICLNSTDTTARQISKIAGYLISMSLALGKIARLFTRQMYKLIESRNFWDEPVNLNEEVLSELKFWQRGLQHNNGFRIKSFYLTTKIVYSDASQDGYGGFIVNKLGNIISRGCFTENEKSSSSTYRELLDVKNILMSVGHLLRNESVQWNSDNINVPRIIEAGSTREHLQSLAVDIYDLCICYDIELCPK